MLGAEVDDQKLDQTRAALTPGHHPAPHTTQSYMGLWKALGGPGWSQDLSFLAHSRDPEQGWALCTSGLGPVAQDPRGLAANSTGPK